MPTRRQKVANNEVFIVICLRRPKRSGKGGRSTIREAFENRPLHNGILEIIEESLSK
jgi:hypothetical protein